MARRFPQPPATLRDMLPTQTGISITTKVPLPPAKEVRKLKGLAAALVCGVVLYFIDAYFYDGHYASHISTLLSQIFIHFRG